MEKNLTPYILQRIGGSNNSNIFTIKIKQANGDDIAIGQVMKLVNNSRHIHNGISTFKCSRECEHLTNEYQILSQIDHPNVIRVQGDFKRNSDFCGIIIERAKIDLFKAISEDKMRNLGVVKQVFRELAGAIDYLHKRNICHNDLKLDNVFLFEEEGKMKTKLADFGFANDSEGSADEWGLRNKQYLAPEILYPQTNKGAVIDKKKSDMFAFGMCLFETVFRRHAYMGNKGKYAHHEDQFFKFIYKGEYLQFWEKVFEGAAMKHEVNALKGQENSNLNGLLNLITGLLVSHPSERFSSEDVLQHPWLNN